MGHSFVFYFIDNFAMPNGKLATAKTDCFYGDVFLGNFFDCFDEKIVGLAGLIETL